MEQIHDTLLHPKLGLNHRKSGMILWHMELHPEKMET